MNRMQKRQMERKHGKKKYSLIDVQKAMNVALEMKQASKGHLFSRNLKDRCVFCGATTKTRSQCKFWLFTLLDRIQVVLINPEFFYDDNVQALWVQNADEYKEIQFPINMHLK